MVFMEVLYISNAQRTEREERKGSELIPYNYALFYACAYQTGGPDSPYWSGFSLGFFGLTALLSRVVRGKSGGPSLPNVMRITGWLILASIRLFSGGPKSTRPFWPKIALHCAQDNLGVKKVSAPSKNPAKWPIICFAREKIISRTFKISGALIVKNYLCEI